MKIRRAEDQDAEGIAKVHVETWRTAYRGIIDDDYLSALSVEKRTELWHRNIAIPGNIVLVAEENGRIVGFTDGSQEETGEYDGFKGDVTCLYGLEEHQGTGLGKALLHELFHAFQKEGIRSAIVKVLKENDACSFYERTGARLLKDAIPIKIGSGRELELCVYGWKDFNPAFLQQENQE
ncbi:GNAT family N-acetyltransferase [Bacillus infantis]|uniref:GNAT family N-acetyltransferase n=1 Tax=Bacillus infantis TaxID=324767 RepID=UPI001CD50E55|nr:GNAT family N-acetyltransferase [Bacillus infantis]MCA1042258.1 GNAT family N-acetyltransferase [Bacillus infantis]